MGGLLNSKTAPQMEREQLEQTSLSEAQELDRNKSRVIDNLALHVRNCWSAAKSHRTRSSDRMTNCLRLRKGQYSSEKLAEIRVQGGSEFYYNIVGTKCNAAKSLLSDLYASSGDKPFEITPTPVADLDPAIQQEMITTAIQAIMQTGLPQEVALQLLETHEDRIKDEMLQEAEARMEKMSNCIEDVLTEGNFRREFESFLDDLVTYPFAILKGPIYRKERKIKWVQGEDGSYTPQISDKITRKFKRVSPFDFYESPSMTNVGDSWHVEHVRFTPQDLTRMRGAKGYNTPNIVLALNDYREGGLREMAFNSSERERLEGKETLNLSSYEMIDGIEWTGTIQGKKLIGFGIDQQIEDEFQEYSVSIVVVGNYTIKATINPDPTGQSNYYKACFRDVPNSFSGEALPEIIEDIQGAANAASRALINNLAIGSQPMVGIDISMLPAGHTTGSVAPGKVWLYSSKNGQTKPGVTFFAPEIKANEILAVVRDFERQADERSGIPAYTYGTDAGGGAGATASGLSMLLNASSKTTKHIVRGIDIGIIEPLITNLYQSAMLDPDVPDECKGDASVKARGSDALMHKEATIMRQLDFMAMTNNPTDMQIIGIEGRREMLETASKNSDFPVGRVIPTQDVMEQRLANAQPDPNDPNAETNNQPQAKQA